MLLDSDPLAKVDAWQRSMDAGAAQGGNDPALAARLDALSRNYWWMSPGSRWSLAKAGIDSRSPAAQAVAYGDAHREVSSGLGFAAVGSPAARPSSPPDVSSILRKLDTPARTGAPSTPEQYAAGTPGPLQQLAGDQWDKLSPEDRRVLGQVQFVASDPEKDYTQAGDLKIAQWDQLDRNLREKTGDIIRAVIGADTKLGDNPESRMFIGGTGYFDYNRGVFAAEGHDLKPTYYDVLAPLAPIIRPSFMVASAPFQEVTGEFRNIYALAHGNSPNFLESQSDLGVAVGDLLHGRPVDTGTGLFVDPQSGVGQERERRLMERGTIHGHGITIGRALADVLPDSVAGVHVFDPDSKGYSLLSGLTDAAAAITLDPAARSLKASAEFRAASKTFAEGSTLEQAAGAFRGVRPMVSKDAANAWLDSPQQTPLLQRIADTKDPYTIWRGLDRKADPALAARLADAEDPAAVANLLRDELGTTIRTKPTIGGLSTSYTSPSRWVANMPGANVPADNLTANVVELERAASLLKAPDEQLHAWFDRMARTTDQFERLGAWEQAMNDTFERLVGKGIPAQRARELTNLWREEQTVEKVYSQDRIGKGLGMFDEQAVVNGEVMTMESRPHLLAQHLDGNIPLPDWRALRKALSPLRPVLENEGVKGAEWLVTRAQNVVWKGLQISTPKTMIKVLADDQAKMAASGYDAMFNHPIRALSMIVATPLSELPEDAGFLARAKQATASRLRWGAEHVPGVEPALTKTVTGEDFHNLWEVQQVAAHGFDTVADDPLGVLMANNWQVLNRTADNLPDFTRAWARDVAQYAASPESRGFARAGSLPEAQDAFWSGELARYRETLAKAGARGHAELLTREGSDRYVDLTMQQIAAKTNGNPELVKAIAEGRLDGASMWAAAADGTPKVSQRFVDKLGGYIDDAPQATRAPKAIYSKDAAQRGVVDRVLHSWLHSLLGTPAAVLGKSPLFRQAYWERIIDNAPFMTDDAQAAVRAAAKEANVGSKLEADLGRAIRTGRKGSADRVVTLEQADTMAKGHGLDTTEFLMDEFTSRSQFFDVLRLVSPFGEVWRKTIQRWGRIIKEQPQVVRRGQQIWEGAHGADLGAFVGAPAGQGFFHKDTFGSEVFSIPGSEWATQALTGVPVPLVGNVQGLSIGTDIWPGLGPVASIPVAWTMQQLHAPPELQQILFPYGPPKDWKDITNVLPSWLQKWVGHDRQTDPDAVGVFDNAVKDVIRYGWTNGDYDMSTPEGIQAAVEDATGKAHRMFWIRGAAQFFIPGAPSPQWLVRDKDGKLLDAAVVIGEYRKLLDEDPNTAGQRFIDMYGPDVFKATTAKSYSYVFGLPTSIDSAKWVDSHPTLRRDFPHVYGYFAPPSDPTKFDYETYLDQIHRGERARLTPEQWTRVANSRAAGLQYGAARDQIDAASNGKPTDAQRAWLARVKGRLIEQYPGYADALYGGSGLPDRPDAKLLVLELSKAVADPTVAKTDAGQGLALFLAKRAEVDAKWTAAGHSEGSWATGTGAWATQLRGYLRRYSGTVIDQHPQFGPLFESVFEFEMRDDTNPNDLGGG